MDRNKILEYIGHHKAVAVLRLNDEAHFEPVCRALYEGGVRIIEITMTTPNALELVRKSDKILPGDMLTGAGTVLDADTAHKLIDAGSRFIVSPVLKKEIIDAAHKLDTVVMPGAFTPTEIRQAWEWGADVVKVFPADALGPAYFKAVKAPMPFLRLMPTGGVSLTNGGEWLEAGAFAVGLGSALMDMKAIQKGDFEQIRMNAETVIRSLGPLKSTEET